MQDYGTDILINLAVRQGYGEPLELTVSLRHIYAILLSTPQYSLSTPSHTENLAVPGFHPGNRGSKPLGDATFFLSRYNHLHHISRYSQG